MSIAALIVCTILSLCIVLIVTSEIAEKRKAEAFEKRCLAEGGHLTDIKIDGKRLCFVEIPRK